MSRSDQHYSTFLKWFLLVGFIAAVALVLLPFFGRTAVRGRQTVNLSNAKQLANMCKIYAADHQGRFPVHLSELEPRYLPLGTVNCLRCSFYGGENEPDFQMAWLYFGAGLDQDNLPRLLIVSPQVATPHDRIVVFGDATGMIVKEALCEQWLNETAKQMEAIQEARRQQKPSATPGDKAAR